MKTSDIKESGAAGHGSAEMVQLNLNMWILHISKDSETPVLKDINLSVKSGETIGIIWERPEVPRPVWSI